MVFRVFISAVVLLFGFARLPGATAQTDKISKLLNNSPFGLSRTGMGPAAGTGDPLEFRAVLEENGSKYFSIYDTTTKRSAWVELNDPANGFTVKDYDAAHDSVRVDFRDKALTLQIKRAPAVAQTAMPNQPGTNAIGPMPTPIAGQGVVNPADQQRIQQIQEEIRRRRALRIQSGAGSAPTFGEGGPQPIPAPANSTGPQSTPARTAGPQAMPLPGANNPPAPQPPPPRS